MENRRVRPKRPDKNRSEPVINSDKDLPVINLDDTQMNSDWIKYMNPHHPLRKPGETNAEFMKRNPIKDYLEGKIDMPDRQMSEDLGKEPIGHNKKRFREDEPYGSKVQTWREQTRKRPLRPIKTS